MTYDTEKFDVAAAMERDFGGGESKVVKLPNYQPGKARGHDEDAEKTEFLPAPSDPPLDVLPAQYRHVVTRATEAFSVPACIPFAALLMLVSACIGRKRGIVIKKGWAEHANLYMAILGKSGTGKSPCVSAFFRSLKKVERKLFEEYSSKLADYNAEIDNYGNASKKDRQSLTKPEPPAWKQLMVDDATIESVADGLNVNPHGLLWKRDELSGLILDMDKYSKKDGGTKARLMSAYDSEPWKINRKHGKSYYIPNACLSIFGTLQPGALPMIFSKTDAMTGFMPRFLFVRSVQEKPQLWTDEEFGEDCAGSLDDLVNTLTSLDFNENDKPILIGMQPAAKEVYIKWNDALVTEPWRMEDENDALDDSVCSKLRGQCLRLCLILHFLEHADKGHAPESNAPVSKETMVKATRLADWFKENQKAVWATIGKLGAVKDAHPIDIRIMKAVYELREKIVDGRLGKDDIFEKINSGVSENLRVTKAAVGRRYKGLGLTSGHSMGFSYVHVSSGILEKFKPFCCQKIVSGEV